MFIGKTKTLGIIAAGAMASSLSASAQTDNWGACTQSGLTELRQGHLKAAQKNLEKAEKLARSKPSATPQVVESEQNLANLLEVQGRYDRAENLYRQILSQSAIQHGRTSGQVAGALGRVLAESGKYTEAESTLKDALRELNARHQSETVAAAQIKDDLARLYITQANFSQAEPLSKQALTIRQKLCGAKSLPVAQSLNTEVLLSLSQGKYVQAEEQANDALFICDDHRQDAQLLNADGSVLLSRAYLEQGKNDRVETLLNNSFQTRNEILGQYHPGNAECVFLLGAMQLQRGDTAKAQDLFKQGLAFRQTAFGENAPQTAPDYLALAMCSLIANDLDQSRSYFDKSISARKSLGNADTVAAAYKGLYVQELWASNHLVEAMQLKSSELPSLKNVVATLDSDGRLLQKSVRQPDVTPRYQQSYNLKSILIVVMATVLPMLLIGLIVLAPGLLSMPKDSEFQYFMKQLDRQKPRTMVREEDWTKVPPKKVTREEELSKQVATPGVRKSVPENGKLSLKSQKEWKLPPRPVKKPDGR